MHSYSAYNICSLDSKGLVVCILAFIFSFTGCSKSDTFDYNQLTDQQKRSAEFALEGLETREGLETQVFAADDMLVNPTNMDIDSNGRVWVTEGYNYRPSLNPENPTNPEGDRILILEDTNKDGKADSSKVFYQGNDINSALGIMVLGNQVIVSRSPHVFVLTDTDGDDKADRKEVLFSGIEGEQHDHGVHAFVFGPDGKLYFNMGNEGKIIKDAEGNVVTDEFDQEVKAEGEPFRQGMIFRTNMDGSDFEVLAHNFRNNYEVAVDSYGSLWQSDNDDDGNKGVRINYVMEYGNYGYTDEFTGAGWRTRRTGMAEDIPTRHWHQKDPGSIPNLLQTGAGSPTGIVVYEGDLLPQVFQNQMIHADAGPNIIRSYPVNKDGAGYSAHIEDILKGNKDQWFRPSDVTVAPDGSIFVADWYDPGVGGHQMGDQQRGRIFRIAPEGHDYKVPEIDLNTPKGAVEALKSPNLNRRAQAWLKLKEWGSEAEPALAQLWASSNQRYRARALWLLSKLRNDGTNYINEALTDDNPDIRITGLRAVRQLDIDVIPYVRQLVTDSSPQVRREAAIALHRNKSPEAPELWAELALQHTEGDRWYLESLGIGAAGQWDVYFEQWLNKVGEKWNSPAGREITWRSRSSAAVPLIARFIKDSETPMEEKVKYFRAFDFHSSPVKQEELATIIKNSSGNEERISILALRHIDQDLPKRDSSVKQALNRALESVRGTYEFVDLVERFEVDTENEALIKLMIEHPDSSLGVTAGDLALQHGGIQRIRDLFNESSQGQQEEIIHVLGETGQSQALDFLQSVMRDNTRSSALQRKALVALGASWSGEDRLAKLVRAGMVPASLDETTSQVLSNAWREEIREVGEQYYAADEEADKSSFESVAKLIEIEGDVENGHQVFQQSCQICHQVNNMGTPFGPALSEIGAKLPKESLYEAIVNPNDGISFGYEGYILTMEDGSRTAGIIESETETDLILLTAGGYSTRYNVSEIASREQMDRSLMPEGLESGMSQQDLVDLVEYLSSLK